MSEDYIGVTLKVEQDSACLNSRLMGPMHERASVGFVKRRVTQFCHMLTLHDNKIQPTQRPPQLQGDRLVVFFDHAISTTQANVI